MATAVVSSLLCEPVFIAGLQPQRELVIVRFGATIDPPDFDMRGLERLTADVIAAVHAPRG